MEVQRDSGGRRQFLNFVLLAHGWLLLVEDVEVDRVVFEILVEHVVVHLNESGSIWEPGVGDILLLLAVVANILSIIHPLLLAAHERLR